MSPMNKQQESPVSINQLQDFAISFVFNATSIVTLPVEMVLRPAYGSRYVSPVVLFFSAMMMILVPMFFSVMTAVGSMIPFARFRGSIGLIGIWGLSRLFFLGAFIHGFRTWKRMLHPESELISYYEGPPLPFFRILPLSFWQIRIVAEPAFVFAAAIFLPNFLILEPSAAHFLMFSAICLAMKEYLAWYLQWQFLRGLLDTRNAGPIIAKIIENRATPDELASVHLASFPKNLPDDIRRSAAIHIVTALSPKGAQTNEPNQ
jgi:hypothetical protein